MNALFLCWNWLIDIIVDTGAIQIREYCTQCHEKLNGWAGIRGKNIIEPSFSKGNLTGQMYRNLTQNEIFSHKMELQHIMQHLFDNF